MSFPDNTIEKIEATFKALADDVNVTSTSARTGWIFFLAIQAYFFIALAGLSHRDLLLGTPVPLPLLQVQIELKGFFLFGPIIFVLVHFGILLQHVMLSRQVRELHRNISNFEGADFFRTHRVRFHLHSYFFTQLIAGPQRSALFSFFLSLLTWVSFGILPIMLLLHFQSTFLPYHDLQVTWAHRFYLVLQLMILATFTVFIRLPGLGFVSGFGRTIAERPMSFLVSFLLGGGAVFFSFCVATIPDERLDKVMTSIWPETIASERQHLDGFEQRQAFAPRQAFVPTARLFEAGIDVLSGRPVGLFGRNLIVVDEDMVKDGQFDLGSTSINLRKRDLRYGIFDRSDLRQADVTGAILTGASLRGTIIYELKAEQAILRGADLFSAIMIPLPGESGPLKAINFRGADLRGANLTNATLITTDFRGAQLAGTILTDAQMDGSQREYAEQQGAKF
jgi:hypothetical protein